MSKLCFRADWHDYRRPGFYMLTLKKGEGVGAFSEVVREGADRFTTRLFPVGEIIRRQVFAREHLAPGIRIYKLVIMPDHIHFLLQVATRLPRPLGNYIASMMGAITSEARASAPETLLRATSPRIFEQGFHDSVILDYERVKTAREYIKDNPRRFWYKAANPDLLSRRYHISIGGTPCQAIGNIFLATHFHIIAVKVSRHCEGKELADTLASFRKEIENGAVVVSPFISRGEKMVRDIALEVEAPIIEIMAGTMHKRYKPQGRFFDYCREGRLLQIATAEPQGDSATLTRGVAMELNRLAKELENGNATFH